MTMIRLKGGPADGETHRWNGQDVFQWAPKRVIDFSEPMERYEDVSERTVTVHEYVRTTEYINGAIIFRHRKDSHNA